MEKITAGHYLYEGRIDGGADRFKNLADARTDIDGRKR